MYNVPVTKWVCGRYTDSWKQASASWTQISTYIVVVYNDG